MVPRLFEPIKRLGSESRYFRRSTGRSWPNPVALLSFTLRPRDKYRSDFRKRKGPVIERHLI